MRYRILILSVLFGAAAGFAFATPLEDALELYKNRNFAEARTALEQLVAAHPQDAAASHWLGLTLLRLRDPALVETAVDALKTASDLEPQNPDYLFEYGAASLQLSGIKRSLTAASRGRDALEKVVELVPSHVQAHEALVTFYIQAPWPIGSRSKAADHIAALRAHAPERAEFVEVVVHTDLKEYTQAMAKADEILARRPDDYGVLLQYARASLLANQNFEKAVERLRHALTIPHPPGMPGHALVHWRLGNLEEKLGDKTAARAAYEEALKADGNFAQAKKSLEALGGAP